MRLFIVILKKKHDLLRPTSSVKTRVLPYAAYGMSFIVPFPTRIFSRAEQSSLMFFFSQ